MSQKELLYYEDAVSHEDATIVICKELVKKLKDGELVDFMNNEIKHHQMMKENLLKQMEECACE